MRAPPSASTRASRRSRQNGTMAETATLCPYCHRHSHCTIQWGFVYHEAQKLRLAATCDNCKRLVVAEGIGSHITGDLGPRETNDPGWVRIAADNVRELSWLPLAAESPDIPDVPESIARAAKEAYSNSTIGNHMSAILMARTVIEASAKAKGIVMGSLAAKINQLRDDQLIRPAIADQAHEVRFFGNDMAHGDIEDAPAPEDAEEVLALMAEVLAEVFQGPARMQRLKAKREAATQSAKPSDGQ